MKYTYPFTAIFKCGYTTVVNNSVELRNLVKEYGVFGYEWLETCFSRAYRYKPFCETYPKDYVPKYFTAYNYEWIVRDFYGLKVDYSLVEFENEPRYSWWFTGRRKAQKKAAEQGLPIPHLRGPMRGRKKYPKNGRRGVAARTNQDKMIFVKNKNHGDFDN